jgi:hypothetical protein
MAIAFKNELFPRWVGCYLQNKNVESFSHVPVKRITHVFLFYPLVALVLQAGNPAGER